MDIILTHKDELMSRFGIRSLKLFGSVARGEHCADSDVDVLVDMPGRFYTYSAANDYLEDLLGCRVDLIRNHAGLSPVFRQQVSQDGITLF